MKKNFQDISAQDFQRHKKSCSYYQQPSPKYLPKLSEFDKLAYVATVFNKKPNNGFKHSDTSPFQSVVPGKKIN
ncbi:hypothetical protein [Rickettsiella endosymbiont of Aleochara curtula]|uniref:hypothetical protein n=1 Tax=Rickettsiella endosymbiont of Aleochara curtula TaxID=3077936 RepID=UPI00313D74ED